jgi:hypothetical protein
VAPQAEQPDDVEGAPGLDPLHTPPDTAGAEHDWRRRAPDTCAVVAGVCRCMSERTLTGAFSFSSFHGTEARISSSVHAGPSMV